MSLVSSRSKLILVALLSILLTLAACASPNNVSSMRSEKNREESPERLAEERDNGEFDAAIAPPAPTKKDSGLSDQAQSFDGDVRSIKYVAPHKKLRLEAKLPSPIAAANGKPDPVVQTGPINAAPLSPAIAPAAAVSGSSFDGLDFTTWGTGWPPDTTGDVGPTHYIQAVNGSVGIWDKATKSLLAAFSLNSFFQAAGATGACGVSNQGDPTVVFDSFSGRWIVANFAWSASSGPYYECIAVSKSGDPVAGGWWIYSFEASKTDMNDYPKMSAWGNGIYMTANMFKGGSTFTGAKVWALNRDDLISGAAIRFVTFQTSSTYASWLAAHSRVSAVADGTPEYLVSLGTSTTLRVWRMQTNWTTPWTSTLSGPTNVTVASYTKAGSVRQPVGDRLDSLSDRLMNRVQYSSVGTPSLWLTHTVSSSSYAAPRWYQLNVSGATPILTQSGTYQPTTSTARWMGSIAVDKVGNAAVGYSTTSTKIFPSLRIAGRSAAATLGTFDLAEQTLFAGTGAQKGGYGRWGDYSDLAVDPADGCTFWFTSEYYSSTGNAWRTRIESFKMAGCV